VDAKNADVKGKVLLRNGFAAEGQVSLLGACIGSDLDCDGGSFKNSGGIALDVESADIKGSVLLRNGFFAGEVNLGYARIGNNLECDGSSFKNSAGMALDAEKASVKGSVFLRNGFSAEGRVSLTTAQVGGVLQARAWRDVQGVTKLDLGALRWELYGMTSRVGRDREA
jgi:sRNA-binding regulator protein Hfq